MVEKNHEPNTGRRIRMDNEPGTLLTTSFQLKTINKEPIASDHVQNRIGASRRKKPNLGGEGDASCWYWPSSSSCSRGK